MVGSDDGISNQDSFGCISDSKTYNMHSSGCNGVTLVADGLSLHDSNAESSVQTDSIHYSSLNLSRATFHDLMEDVKIELMLDMKTMIEENRKQIEEMNEGNRKEMKDMNEENRKEMRSMIKDIRKENARTDGKIKGLYKRVQTEIERRS